MGEVIDMNAYKDQSNNSNIKPEKLSDSDYLMYVLSLATHPSVVSSPGRIANSILSILPGDSDENASEWKARAKPLSVKVTIGELDDEEFDIVAADDIFKKAQAVIRAKNGHYIGNETIIEATRALIKLRAGLVLDHSELLAIRPEKWQQIIEGLGKAAIKQNQ